MATKVDKVFDKMHELRQVELRHLSRTPFSYPVFVVWRNLPNGERKGRVVIDIRALNKISQSDTYPLPRQSDIIAAVAGYQFVTVVDAVGWFHQFKVKREDRHKFAVVSHRGQEQSSVALMA